MKVEKRPAARRIVALLVAAVVLIGLGAIVFALRGQVAGDISNGLARRDIAAAFHKRRLNFVILGTQLDEGTTDTIILAHADLDRRLATLVSIPRDAWVAVPGHGHQKLNAAYAYGGAALAGRLVGALTGAHVDATIAVDPAGAKQMVDALGGLNINVERDMDYDDNYGNLHIHLKKGEQYLSGGQVLAYMRFRHDVESDWGRMRRQQQVLHELARELGEPQNWGKVPRLVSLARKDIATSLNDAQLRALVELYRGVPPDNVRTFTLPGKPGFAGDASVVFVDDRWAKIVGALVCAPADPPAGNVLVANGTGVSALAKTVVGALRGGGWNVQTFIDEPAKAASVVAGNDGAARRLGLVFGIRRVPASATVLHLGTDAVPDT